MACLRRGRRSGGAFLRGRVLREAVLHEGLDVRGWRRRGFDRRGAWFRLRTEPRPELGRRETRRLYRATARLRCAGPCARGRLRGGVRRQAVLDECLEVRRRLLWRRRRLSLGRDVGPELGRRTARGFAWA